MSLPSNARSVAGSDDWQALVFAEKSLQFEETVDEFRLGGEVGRRGRNDASAFEEPWFGQRVTVELDLGSCYR